MTSSTLHLEGVGKPLIRVFEANSEGIRGHAPPVGRPLELKLKGMQQTLSGEMVRFSGGRGQPGCPSTGTYRAFAYVNNQRYLWSFQDVEAWQLSDHSVDADKGSNFLPPHEYAGGQWLLPDWPFDLTAKNNTLDGSLNPLWHHSGCPWDHYIMPPAYIPVQFMTHDGNSHIGETIEAHFGPMSSVETCFFFIDRVGNRPMIVLQEQVAFWRNIGNTGESYISQLR